MGRLVLPDTELHYDDSGPGSTGETVVFSHGLLMNNDLFAAQIAALRGEFRCIAYEHRGQGRSAPSPLRCIDLGRLTGDAVEVVERVAQGPVHFVGLSMGGFVGLRLAARRPDLVRSLTAFDSSADPEPEPGLPRFRAMNLFARTFGSALLAPQIMHVLFGRTFLTDPGRAEERARWQRHLEQLPRRTFRAVNGVLERESVYPELGRIVAPTLIVVGEEDVATVPACSERMHAAIAGSRLVRIPAAGHSATIEQPERTTAVLREFLRALPRA